MGSPSAERWLRIEALMDGALDLPESEREAFLRTACGNDDDLLTEVRALIEAGEHPRILAGESAIAMAADLVGRIAQTSSSTPAQQRVGPFRLIAELGQGGMGTVYLAEREEHFAQRVAVKVIRRGLHLDADFVRRFVDERQMLASLDHPGIARVLDGGVTDDGLPWFAMELVDGEPVDRFADGRRLSIDGRLELFCAIADAVNYAHQRGIVHRDLKPTNILVRADGSVKLLDFGVAKLLAPDDGAERLTRTGARLLTPEFASPEQIRGNDVTPASDVYSLGVLLYELLTGCRPYRVTGRSAHDVERAVLEQDPPLPSIAARDEPASPNSSILAAAERAHARRTTPEALAARVRGRLDAVVLHALAKAPGDRYATADAFADDVRRTLQGESVVARPPRGSRRQWPVIAAAVIVAAAALGVWALSRSRASGGAVADRASPVLAVGLITDYRQPGTTGVARSLADLLATNLARVPAIRTVSTAHLYELMAQRGRTDTTDAGAYSAAARRAGATAMVDGSLYTADNGTLRLDLRWVDLSSGQVRLAKTITGHSLFALVDSGTAGIASELGARNPGGSVADVTSTSEVAYRFYEEGLRAYYRGDGRTARRLFETAVAEDSSFAMAFYYLAYTTSNPVDSRGHLDRALRLAGRLGDRERLFIEAAYLYTFADPRAVAKADTLASRYPHEPTGQLLSAQARLASGDLAGALGIVRALSAADSGIQRDTSARCSVCEARAIYASALLVADSLPAAERALRHWTVLEPNRAGTWASLSGLLEVRGDTNAAREAYRRAVEIDPALQGTANYYAYHAMRRGEYESTDRALGEIVRTGSPERQAEANWYRAISLREQGRFAEALHVIRTHHTLMVGLNPNVPRGQFLLPVAQAMFELGRHRESIALFDSAGNSYRGWPASFEARYRTWTLGLAANPLAALNDTTALNARADLARKYGEMSLLVRDRRMHHYLRGLVLAARGDNNGAIAEYRRAVTWPAFGYTRIDYELGRALLAEGRPKEAIPVLQPAMREFEATALYVTRTEVRELLGRAWDAAGSRDSAIVHYRAVVRAWQRADPRLRARVDSLRSRLAVLERQ